MGKKSASERVGFFVFPGAEYPTEDGRRLRFTTDDAVIARLEIRNETRTAERGKDFDPSSEPTTDILSADLSIADAEGQWRPKIHPQPGTTSVASGGRPATGV